MPRVSIKEAPMSQDQKPRTGTKPDAAPSPTEQRAGAGEVSPSERQQPPGEQQGDSVLQQQAEQQKRAQESQDAPVRDNQNVGPGESEPPLAPRPRDSE